MRVDQALAEARAAGLSRLDAQLLLAHVLGRAREWLLAHDEQRLDPAQQESLRRLFGRRTSGEPLAYLVGQREFRGLALNLTPAVLVPRPETEGLVEWAIELLDAAPAPCVVDLGTGSGAVALAIKSTRGDIAVAASDSSTAALEVARANASRHGLALEIAAGHWWTAWVGRRFGLAVSNPPYVATGDPHMAQLTHEPRQALESGADGLTALREIVAGAPEHLLPGAWLLVEHGYDQARAVREMLVTRGFAAPATRRDLAGLDRYTGAPWPATVPCASGNKKPEAETKPRPNR
jgi:release factor glutamine methyltransferase